MHHRLNTALAAVLLAGCSSPASTASQGAATSQGATTTTTSTTTGPGGGAGPAPACDNLQGEGYTAGQIAENWSLPDHLGQMIALFDFCGKVIFFEEGSMW